MRLNNPEAVASALEAGLGGIPTFEGFRPDMRLRMPGVCGLAPIALREHIPGSRLVMTRPNLAIDREMRHVFLAAPFGGDEVIIDTSYTHLLCYAGLSPGYILHGGPDNYPKDKIAVFSLGDSGEVVAQLTKHARLNLDTYVVPKDRYYNSHRELAGMSDEEIAAQYAAVWDPTNFTDYHPEDFIEEGGRMIAKHIVAEHVQLVA